MTLKPIRLSACIGYMSSRGFTVQDDADGKLAGLEILDATRRFGGEETLQQVILEGIGPMVRK